MDLTDKLLNRNIVKLIQKNFRKDFPRHIQTELQYKNADYLTDCKSFFIYIRPHNSLLLRLFV